MNRNFLRFLGLGLALVVLTNASAQADFVCGAWNLESGDSDEQFLAKQIRQWPEVAIWGFSEVRDGRVLETLGAGLNDSSPNAQFMGILGTTGNADRLGIVFASSIFDCQGSWELDEINVGGTVRAPLVALMRERATGKDFLFVVNHFYRGKSFDEPRREQQSLLLSRWAADQDRPVIAVGDFNFDCDVDHMGQCNRSFNVLLENGVFKWAVPKNPMRTQCNRRYNSILDFVFVTGQAKSWLDESWILNTGQAACEDDAQKTDHRPVIANFNTE